MTSFWLQFEKLREDIKTDATFCEEQLHEELTSNQTQLELKYSAPVEYATASLRTAEHQLAVAKARIHLQARNGTKPKPSLDDTKAVVLADEEVIKATRKVIRLKKLLGRYQRFYAIIQRRGDLLRTYSSLRKVEISKTV